MNIIVCVDDKLGIAFADRRQSRDREQIAQMLKTVGENKLYISDYSAKLFDSLPQNVIVCNDFADVTEDAYCFVENIPSTDIFFSADKIILYRWNRVYPSDIKFPQDALANKKLVSSYDFKGHSHDKITEEIFE